MTSIDDFIQYVQPSVGGCPEILVKRDIISSAIELCSEGMLWREDGYPFPMIENVHTYELDVPDENGDADPVQLEDLTFQGRSLRATSNERLTRYDGDWKAKKGDPAAFTLMNSHSIVRLNRTPGRTLTQALVASFILKPKRTATTLPDFLYNDWLEPISHGAISRLCIIPNKNWTNQDLADRSKIEYNLALTDARILANKQWTDGDLVARGRKVLSNKINYF